MKSAFLIVIMGLLILASGCVKTANNTSDPIVFTTDAAASNISVASNFPVAIKITSRISYSGLKVTISAIEEVSGLTVAPQPPAIITNAVDNSSSIINLPQQKWVVATIKVTDVNNANNIASKSFRVIYK